MPSSPGGHRGILRTSPIGSEYTTVKRRFDDALGTGDRDLNDDSLAGRPGTEIPHRAGGGGHRGILRTSPIGSEYTTVKRRFDDALGTGDRDLNDDSLAGRPGTEIPHRAGVA